VSRYLNSWTVLCQPDLLGYFFVGRKGMFLFFYVKFVPVDTALTVVRAKPKL
jgi:hypothetical protein